MRFFALTTLFLATAVLAQPPPAVSAPSGDDPCCCCDISRNVIGCTYTIAASECFCAAVECPQGAPTVYDDMPTSTSGPQPSMTSTSASDCTAVSPPAVTTVAPPPSDPTPPSDCDAPHTGYGTACCCCDIRKEQMFCQMKEPGDCFCAAVVCPANAKTVWADPAACTA